MTKQMQIPKTAVKMSLKISSFSSGTFEVFLTKAGVGVYQNLNSVSGEPYRCCLSKITAPHMIKTINQKYIALQSFILQFENTLVDVSEAKTWVVGYKKFLQIQKRKGEKNVS